MAVLLVGSTGMGKSTLGNFLLDPDNLKQDFKVAVDNLPTTEKTMAVTRLVKYKSSRCASNTDTCQGETAEASTATTHLEQDHDSESASCLDSDVLYDASSTSTGLQLVKTGATPVPQSKYLTVIDTPGLNDGPKKDLQHMIDLVENLQKYETIRACIFVVKFSAKIDHQYKDTIRYFSRLQPSLFSHNSIIVVTDYATDPRSVRKRKREGIDDSRVFENIIKQIIELSGMCYEPIVFGLDCLPDLEEQKELCAARSKRDDLLSLIFSQIPVYTKNIMIAKTNFFLEMDQREISRLKGEAEGYNKRLIEADKSLEELLNSILQKEFKRSLLEREISVLTEELQLKNTDELVTSASWSIDSRWKFLRSQSLEFNVVSEWDIAKVSKWDNGRCTWVQVQMHPRKVSGCVESRFMRGLQARITLETKKREKFAKEIAALQETKIEKSANLDVVVKDLEQMTDRQKDTAGTIKLLRDFIEERSKSIQELNGNLLTLDQARKRLSKLTTDK